MFHFLSRLKDNVPVLFFFFKFKYILFDGLTYNTRGYFASCVGKVRAMSKMSASIIY